MPKVYAALNVPPLGHFSGGRLMTFILGDLGLGAQFSKVCPPNMGWEVVSLGWRLQTSAVVANRVSLARVRVENQDTHFFGALLGVGAAASTSYFFSQSGTAEIATSGFVIVPLPRIFVPPGGTLFSNVTNFDAGDQLQLVTLQVLAVPLV